MVLGEKGINRRYRYFIRREAADATKADRRSENLLAKAFYAKLTAESLKGFYYPKHENNNAEVERKLRSGCQSCRVFVQLVENVMFDPPDGHPNYCEFEYRRAVEFIQGEGRILFVVAAERPEDLEDPETVHEEYRDWLGSIRIRAAPYLPPVEEYDRQRIADIGKKLADVISQVKAAKRKVLDGIPQ